MDRKTYFYMDDVIWIFRDIHRERPKSIFDNPIMKVFKEAHDKYGFKVMLNSFFRTDYFYGDDEFTLKDMTDEYKKEWEENSDWIRIAFHAKQEFPDYPFINSTYDDMKNSFLAFKKEVVRFAGEKVMSMTFNPHWGPVSKEGCRALGDLGIIVSSVTTAYTQEYNGDPLSLPYCLAGRLLQNRQPETKVLKSEGSLATSYDVCILGYNNFTKEEVEDSAFTFDYIKRDKETGLNFKKHANFICLNTVKYDDIAGIVEKHADKLFLGGATHEQYSYPDYYAYQSDHLDKILKLAEELHKNGYEYTFLEDILEK